MRGTGPPACTLHLRSWGFSARDPHRIVVCQWCLVNHRDPRGTTAAVRQSRVCLRRGLCWQVPGSLAPSPPTPLPRWGRGEDFVFFGCHKRARRGCLSGEDCPGVSGLRRLRSGIRWGRPATGGRRGRCGPWWWFHCGWPVRRPSAEARPLYPGTSGCPGI